jgi:hypothetical protein
MPDVCTLNDHHPRILPQLPGQLSITDIHGKDPACTVLKKAVGKPAGGGAHIETGKTGYINFHGLQSAFEFKAASAYIGNVFSFQNNDILCGDLCPGFIHEMVVDQNFSSHNKRPGTVSTVCEFFFYNDPIESFFVWGH